MAVAAAFVAVLALALAALPLPASAASPGAAVAAIDAGHAVPASVDSPDGLRLVQRLRSGGLVLFFRHADTRGMPCDRSFQVGDRQGQRNLSEDGVLQSRRIGERLAALGIPVEAPVLAGPVYRARDTAEAAFGAAAVKVTDSLLADDYAAGRIGWVLDEHRRLFSAPVPAGANRVLVGHRTPAILVLGHRVAGRAFPEGAALVLEPAAKGAPSLLGILELAPLPGGGFHAC